MEKNYSVKELKPRKTKIICTMGPASENEETVKKMILAGMNVARFNMSHGDYADHARRMNLVRKCAEELKMPVGILLDTKGPEIRIKKFQKGKVQLKEGQKFTFCTNDVQGDNTKVSITYPDLYKDLKPGDKVLVNDGLLQFVVDSIQNRNIITHCIRGGVLSDQKSMNFPHLTISMPYLSEVDKQDILFGIKQKIDFIAASFVSNRDNILQIRQILNENGVGRAIDIIAKIENDVGIHNLEEIYQVSDGCMVARGDMGVEIPFAELPSIQKLMVQTARRLGRRCIVATEMLESMIENPRPTRAETSDIANAVYDGATAVMLSGETAAGKYPVQCVETMSKICQEAESHLDYFTHLVKDEFVLNKVIPESIAFGACNASYTLKAPLIVVFTTSGASARNISRFRPECHVIAATFSPATYSKLTLTWGVTPVLVKKYETADELLYSAEYIAFSHNMKIGEKYIVVAGLPNISDGTNMLKLCTLSA